MSGARTTNPIDGLLTNLQASAGTPMNMFETFFDSIGMMRGSYAPMYRAFFGFGACSLLIFALRPSFWFYSDGGIRPWSALDPDTEGSVAIPWWSAAAACGLIAGTFV